MPSTILSDNGVSSGTAGIKTTAASDGSLALQTTTAGGTATTAMTISTSQNVGVGNASPAKKLDVTGVIRSNGATDDNFQCYDGSTTTSLQQSSNNLYFNSNVDSATAGGFYWRTTSSYTTLMRLDSSGNLGIGATSPTCKLDVRGNTLKIYDSGTTNANLTIRNSTTGDAAGFTIQQDGVNTLFYTASNGYQSFFTNATERARIDTSGNLLVGATALTQNASYMGFSPANGFADFGHINGSVSGLEYLKFLYNGSKIGSITQNGTTAVAYNTSSDYRLKHDIAPMTGALARVAALKPVTYKWNADESEGEGFIAHELAEVCPHAVTGDKDAVDEEGNPKYQGIDTSFLVATLTAAIQEQQALIAQLQADVATLKGQA